MIIIGVLLAAGVVAGSEDNGDVETTTSFDSQRLAKLDLVGAQRIALEQSPDIKTVEARIRIAAANVKRALSRYYPQVTATISADHIEKVPILQTFGAAGRSGENYLMQANASWLIFDGLVREFEYQARKYDKLSAVEAARDARRILANSVAQAFYNALLAKSRMSIAATDQEYNQKFLDDMKLRKKFGAASDIDVLNFELRVANANIEELDAENELRIAKIALSELLGLSNQVTPEDINLVDDLVEPPAESAYEFSEEMKKCVEFRPDVKKLAAETAAAALTVKSRRGALFPRFEVVGEAWAFRRDEFRFDGDDVGETIGVVAVWDLFTGGDKWEAYKSSREEVIIAQSELQRQWDIIAGDVRRELEQVDSAIRKLNLQKTVNQLSRRIRNNVEKEFKAGTASITRLNEAQRDLIFAEQNFALTKIEYHRAISNLEAATGYILEAIEVDQGL